MRARKVALTLLLVAVLTAALIVPARADRMTDPHEVFENDLVTLVRTEMVALPKNPPLVIAFIQDVGSWKGLSTLNPLSGLAVGTAWAATGGLERSENPVIGALEEWPIPEHDVKDHSPQDACLRLAAWEVFIRLWVVDRQKPDLCICTEDRSKCILVWRNVLIPSCDKPGKAYRGVAVILKYGEGTGSSTIIPGVEDVKESWMDPDRSAQPCTTCPIDIGCMPEDFGKDYNK